MKLANGCLAGVVAMGLAAPAIAQQAAATLATAYTDISRKLCDSDHKPGARLGPDEMVSFSCKGVAGLRIDVAYAGTSLRVTLRDGGDSNAQPQLGASHDIGDRIEWRGHHGVRGFAPEAAILRLTSYDDDAPARRLGSVLAVLRIAGKSICPAAFIDVAGTPQPNEVARRIADEAAASFQCGVDHPRVIGPETTLVKEARARSG